MLRETRRSWLAALGLLVGLFLLGDQAARGGGPLLVGGPGFGIEGQPFVWSSTSMPIQYRTDGGNLGRLSNATTNSRVAGMFQVWRDVPTAAISFTRAGGLLATGVLTDGDVNTVEEFDAVAASCDAGSQSPILYDVFGTLFRDLVGDPFVIGLAGPCALDTSTGKILSALALFNGLFQDATKTSLNPELTTSEFDAVMIHEFGHFIGLDHSQINFNCLSGTNCASFSDDTRGVPTMFPFFLPGREESPGVSVARTLAADDIAWASALYPTANFNTGGGRIAGTIFFSDASNPVQGANVITRRTDDPRAQAVSVVSGYLFTGNPGQSVTADYLPCSPASACPPNGFLADNSQGSPFGSRDIAVLGLYEIPGLRPGNYTVEVEQINGQFVGGSSVGPLDPPISHAVLTEFYNIGESADDDHRAASVLSVPAGALVQAIDVILNGTPPPSDALEPNDSIAAAPLVFNGHIEPLNVSPFGDQDVYSFLALDNRAVTISVRAFEPDGLDPVLEIVDQSGVRLSTCQDHADNVLPPPVVPDATPNDFDDPCINLAVEATASSKEARLRFQAPADGQYFFRVLDFRGFGRPDLQYFIQLFEAAHPKPTLMELSPSFVLAGSPSTLLTVKGADFAPGAGIVLDNRGLATTFISSSELSATIPSTFLSQALIFQVIVRNRFPSFGPSDPLPLTVGHPKPSVTSLFPEVIPAGSSSLTLAIHGTNFGPFSVVRWNGADKLTTFVNDNRLQAVIDTADLMSVGTAQVTVINPAPGGGTSNGLPFTISLRNPVPTVTGLEPPGAVAGGGNFMLTVTGSNFVFNSDVHWNGSPQPTIWKNKQKLEATISAADILGPGPTTATVAVVNPAPGGGTSNPATFFITAAPNPLPVISSISPASAPVSRSGLALTVNGTAFQANSVVRLDGAPRPTTFASASQLQAALLPDDLTTAATRLVTVFTPVPGGGTSNDIAFTATNPLPTLSALSPANLPGGSSGFALTVTGTNFVPGSMVQWDGAALATSFVGPTTLRATVPAGNVATTGMVDVTVETPTPGGGTSAAQGFTITAGGNPPPALTSLMPSSAPAGRNGFLLTVDGSDFVHGSVVRWNGADRLTTFLSSTQLLAVISDADVAAAIPVDVTVFTPPPGGGLSMTSLPFTLLALPGPAPPAGHAPLGRARSEANTGTRVGTVEGATARSGATAVLGGETGRADEAKSKDRASSDPAGALREASGQAEHLFRTVVAEAPVIESVSPEEIKAGSGEVTLIVRGRGFREDSVARLNGRELETTYVSLFRLEATLTRADLPKPGTAQLTVFNPTDSKESAPQRLLVAPPH